jgi:hypothetical protein
MCRLDINDGTVLLLVHIYVEASLSVSISSESSIVDTRKRCKYVEYSLPLSRNALNVFRPTHRPLCARTPKSSMRNP